MTKVYLVRHGENLANITKQFSYKKIDYGLTEKGVQQSIQTADYFMNIKIDAIYSSPLKRAIQTSSYIAEKKEIKTVILENFREINVGDLEYALPNEENWNLYYTIIEDWYSGNKENKFPNGENYSELLSRFIEGFKVITNYSDGGTIILVGHGGIFTAGIIELCSITDKKEFGFRQNHNCSISEINIKNNNGILDFELIRWADFTHLSGSAANFINGLPEKKDT